MFTSQREASPFIIYVFITPPLIIANFISVGTLLSMTKERFLKDNGEKQQLFQYCSAFPAQFYAAFCSASPV